MVQLAGERLRRKHWKVSSEKVWGGRRQLYLWPPCRLVSTQEHTHSNNQAERVMLASPCHKHIVLA
jgi:hypothetical protein